jgi:acetylornithine deacetylase/succinyl-diaminopimelate desuccinylase-like protein
MERLDRLYAIGGGRGANRIGDSPEEQEAHDLAAGWMREAGLEVDVDAAGNLLGLFPGEGPAVWSGSHLDSVPEGGRFDGALGVVAALEAVERLGPQRRPLGVVVFRDEERGCVGSRARRSAGGLPGAYLELHVEQGQRLARADAPLGLVTAIAGLVRSEVVFEGEPGHAGTVPMSERRDALRDAAAYVLRVAEEASAIDGAVATVGRIEVEPGAANVIPGRVSLTVDARAPDAERLGRLVRALGLDPNYNLEPVPMSAEPLEALRAEVEARGLPVLELTSGAGHDAGILASAGVRSAMLFVRSLNGGVSHSPDEESDPDDIALAVDVLTGALGRLVSAP